MRKGQNRKEGRNKRVERRKKGKCERKRKNTLLKNKQRRGNRVGREVKEKKGKKG